MREIIVGFASSLVDKDLSEEEIVQECLDVTGGTFEADVRQIVSEVIVSQKSEE